jgi:uncharacterized protein (TIGR03435 family)
METFVERTHNRLESGALSGSKPGSNRIGFLRLLPRWFVLLGVVAMQPVCSQTTDAFEVVSVKPINRGTRGDAGTSQIQALTIVEIPACDANGRFVSSGMPITLAIQFAYNLGARELVVTPGQAGPRGLPNWVLEPDGLYDIDARAGRPMTLEQCKTLVQQLLSDRFKLKIHFEAKQTPVYELVAAKNGPKNLIKATDSDRPPGVLITVGGQDRTPSLGYARDALKGWTMMQLSSYLSPYTDRNVVDKTGLEGPFRFTLNLPPRGRTSDEARDDIFSALEKQLGLKLEPKNEPYPTLVIDRLERPEPN